MGLGRQGSLRGILPTRSKAMSFGGVGGRMVKVARPPASSIVVGK